MHGVENIISYSPVENHAEVPSLSSPHSSASNICHAGYVSHDGAYFMIPLYEQRVKLALKGIYFNYLSTEISESA
jgi:hypothetical protein